MSYTYANLPIEQVRPNAKNTRTHSKKQIRQIATSIRELGFAAPVLVDEYDVLIAGHGRLEAARSLGMASIPAIVLDGLSDAKKRALMLADNRIAQSAGWDREQLSIELAALPELLCQRSGKRPVPAWLPFPDLRRRHRSRRRQTAHANRCRAHGPHG